MVGYEDEHMFFLSISLSLIYYVVLRDLET